MSKEFEFYSALFRTSLRASITKRKAFLIETALMMANNLVFFSIWWIFFRQFDDVAGWMLDDLLALMTVGLGAYGLMIIFFGGIKSMARIIVNGDLDPFMIQPKNLLIHLIGSRSLSKGWGQLATCFIFMFCGNFVTLSSLPLILVSMVTGALVFASIGVIASSLPFWLGAVEDLSKKYFDSLFLFALYPSNIYSGLLQLIMFTLIPAGVITYLPVELIRNFSWSSLMVLIGSTALFVLAAFAVFYTGLRKYESGNKFGIRA